MDQRQSRPDSHTSTSDYQLNLSVPIRGRPQLSSFSLAYTASRAVVRFLKSVVYGELCFSEGASKSTFSMYYFGREGGVTKRLLCVRS